MARFASHQHKTGPAKDKVQGHIGHWQGMLSSREDFIARQRSLVDDIWGVCSIDENLIAQMLPDQADEMPNVRLVLPNEAVLIFDLQPVQSSVNLQHVGPCHSPNYDLVHFFNHACVMPKCPGWAPRTLGLPAPLDTLDMQPLPPARAVRMAGLGSSCQLTNCRHKQV